MSSVYTVTQGPSHLGFIYPSTPLSAPRLDSTATSSTSETISPETLKKLNGLFTFLKDLNETLYQENLKSLVEQCKTRGVTYLLEAETLDLSHFGLREVPEEFGLMTNVRELVLINNQLSDLPKSLISMRSLRLIRLEGNKFKHLPEVIYRIAMDHIENKKTLGLCLNDNHIDFLPESIKPRVWSSGNAMYSSSPEFFPYNL